MSGGRVAEESGLRHRHKRLLMFTGASVLVVAALPISAGANTASMQASAYGVTQTFKVDFNTGQCSNGVPKIQITGGRVQWRRENTRRNVSKGHMFLAQGYKDCSGGADSYRRKVTNYPTFGCLGRCSNLKTEEVGMVVSWGYTHRDGDGNAASGSDHGHVTNRSGTELGGICTKVILHNLVTGCD